VKKLFRIIDANINRSQEGLRVCEDIVRFYLDDKRLTHFFKSARHEVYEINKVLGKKKIKPLYARNVKSDKGKKTTPSEKRRKDIADIFGANAQRSKESIRVLEEISKLVDKKISERFKKLRFRIYEKEKITRKKLESVLHNR